MRVSPYSTVLFTIQLHRRKLDTLPDSIQKREMVRSREIAIQVALDAGRRFVQP